LQLVAHRQLRFGPVLGPKTKSDEVLRGEVPEPADQQRREVSRAFPTPIDHAPVIALEKWSAAFRGGHQIVLRSFGGLHMLATSPPCPGRRLRFLHRGVVSAASLSLRFRHPEKPARPYPRA